jgi:uncharacterized membrane protein
MRQSVVKLPSVPRFAKRCFFLAAGFLVAAAIVLLCINLYLHSDGVEQRIRAAALQSLGTEVKIRSTMYTPWSGLVLRGISVADPKTRISTSLKRRLCGFDFLLFRS